MTEKELSRRRLMQIGIGTAAASALSSVTSDTLAHASNRPAAKPDFDFDFDKDNKSLELSIGNAYLFLDQMMDAYAQGDKIRLCQSYSDQIAGGTFFSTAFVYDNALLVLAYLARGRASERWS
jgi:hypothetical protein